MCVGFFPRAEEGCLTKFRCFTHRARGANKGSKFTFSNILKLTCALNQTVRRGFRGDMQNLERPLTGKQKKQKRPVVTEIQIALPSSLRFLINSPPFCENNRSFNQVSQKAAERCRSSKVTSRESYFGASDATMASKRVSPRSGSQSGLRRK
jgi:hypothetical protein